MTTFEGSDSEMIRPGIIVDFCWLTLGVYWLITAAGTKKVAVNENTGLRALRLAIIVVLFVLLGTNWLRIGVLGSRFVPWQSWIIWIGVALSGAGVGLAIWARWRLGRNWSDKVVLKVDHELIRNGPYRYLRHPIYTGVLVALAGTALVIGEWRGVVAVILMGLNYYIKATREEKILAASFGEAFAEHKKRTGFFLPGM
jgi:protein-S-isoprenylcysteine O-methyltransferase Ste14